MDDASAFSALYEREGERILLYLTRRTFDAEVALELTAETFAVALESWRRVGELPPEAARAWLFTVASRLHGRYVRRAQVERRAVQRLGIQVPTAHEDDLGWIEERSGLAELRSAVKLELGRLNNGRRQAVRLRIVEDRPYAEVAEFLGITETAARARVSRGLRELAAALPQNLDRQERP